MNNRIRLLRRELDLTQDEFAKKIDLSRNYINLIEMGKKVPADRTIRDICRIFSVNEKWLKDGIEPMLLLPEDEEASYVSELLEDTDNPLYDLIKAVMKTYSELGEKEKTVLKEFAQTLKENLESKKDQG